MEIQAPRTYRLVTMPASLNAFWRVARSLRFNVLAIRAACVLFRATDLKVFTCAGVHSTYGSEKP
jgi:hypothetical protein